MVEIQKILDVVVITYAKLNHLIMASQSENTTVEIERADKQTTIKERLKVLLRYVYAVETEQRIRAWRKRCKDQHNHQATTNRKVLTSDCEFCVGVALALLSQVVDVD